MKISQKIEQAKKENRTWWSFEYFPPRTAQGLQNLVDRIERMRLLGPEFIDITWHSGGRTSDLTTQMVKFCQSTIGVETCMHLTCTNMQPEKIDIALNEAKKNTVVGTSLPFEVTRQRGKKSGKLSKEASYMALISSNTS